jgi:very-short-patch-repair endonuclease
MHPKLPEELREFARKLRDCQTDAERLLWLLLRNRRIGGFKFRRQHPEGPYTLDFYCREAKLVVEADGGEHNENIGIANDLNRTNFLEKRGIHVIRFWNHDVLQQTEAVLEKIYATLLERSAATPPSSSGPVAG